MGMKMYGYISQSPKAMENILHTRKEHTKAFVDLFAEKKPDRIYLCGCGTSYNACAGAARFMERVLDTEVTVFTPTLAPSIEIVRKTNPIFIAVSQGGSSTNTTAAVERFCDYPWLALTAQESCVLNDKCGSSCLIACGEEDNGAKTMGYYATVLSLYVLALEAGQAAGTIAPERYNDYILKIEREVRAMPENVRRTRAWYERNLEELKQMKKITIIGKGVASAIAAESALKLVETVRYPAMGYEFEEYLHGPDDLLDEELYTLMLLSRGEQHDRMLSLIEFQKNGTEHNFVVSLGEDLGEGRNLSLLSVEDEDFTPFEQMLPAQVIAALLPPVIGREESPEYFSNYYDLMGTKAPGGK